MNAIVKSQRWHDEHRATIGSSIAAAVCGVNPYMTAADAFDYMTGASEPFGGNAHTERGALMEPIARRKLAEKTGHIIEPNAEYGFVYHDRYPFAHALPDGWIKGKPVPVELKVPTPQNWQMIRLKGVHDYWLIQCLHQIAMTDSESLLFGALNPVTMQVIDITVTRDQALIDSIMERESVFFDLVKRGERPPDGRSTEAVELPEVGGSMVTINTDASLAAAAAYIEAQQIRKDAEALEESAKARIEEMMAGSDVAELPGLRVYNREQAGRVTFDKKALAKAHPEIDLSQYEKHGKPFRTFRAYRLGR